MALRVPSGISSFRRLREDGLAYVDKTHLISDLIDDPSLVVLLPRPRRFGKTTNLSMLRCFFEKSTTSLWPLFATLAIDRAGPAYRAHFQRYPVLYVSFKDIRGDDWDTSRRDLAQLLSTTYGEHDYLLDAGALTEQETADFTAVLRKQAGDEVLRPALRNLSMYLARHHRERTIILLDEYDTPVHAAYLKGYYEPAVSFLRDLLSAAFKDNDHLHKGVLTGILRVAKDSIFTGLNNVTVYTLLSQRYATAFGFTEPEVSALLEQAGMSESLPEVQRWYDGYLFGDTVIYNPWSVLAFLHVGEREAAPYWADTSGNHLLHELLLTQGMGLNEDMERLLSGQTISKAIEEHVVLRDLRDDPELVWSFLLFTGYLRIGRRWREEGTLHGELTLPNQEVRSIYRKFFLAWTSAGLGGDRRRQELITALLRGDADTAARLLQDWLASHASLWDTAAYDPPERFYHGFVLGLLVSLGSSHEVVSNRESGYGRCDVMLVPRTAGQPGVVLELKVRPDGKTTEQALEAALLQLRERDYARALRDRGAAPIHALALVFDHKRVFSRAG